MMMSRPQLIILHKSANAWHISRTDYKETLMLSTGHPSAKDFTNQGHFNRAMAALETRAVAMGTWDQIHPDWKSDYWRESLAKKSMGENIHGEHLATSAQQRSITDLMKKIRELHPRLKADPEAVMSYLINVMDRVTGGDCIIQSCLTVRQARAVLGSLHKSLVSWQKKIYPPLQEVIV